MSPPPGVPPAPRRKRKEERKEKKGGKRERERETFSNPPSWRAPRPFGQILKNRAPPRTATADVGRGRARASAPFLLSSGILKGQGPLSARPGGEPRPSL